MLSGVIVVVALMCYCCHKNIRKSRPQEYSQYWRTEPDVHSLEVFSTEAHIAVSGLASAGSINSIALITESSRNKRTPPPKVDR